MRYTRLTCIGRALSVAGRKDISNRDRELFRNSVGPVDDIKHDRVHTPERRTRPYKNTAIPKSANTDREELQETSLPAVGMGDALYYCRPGLQHRTLARLKKGQLPIEDELDLHGLRIAEAGKRLSAFLDYCKQEGIQCIRIIHGKGKGSSDRFPVIKNMLNSRLRNDRDILAFTSAPVSDGGTGVLYVLIKKQ